MIKVSTRTKKTSFQVEWPEANTVAVVGNFNEWDADATPMKKNRSGVWKADLVLDEGNYEFRYLVNGQEWRNDEEAAATPNVFGSYNSAFSVELPKKKTTRKTTAKKSSKK